MCMCVCVCVCSPHTSQVRVCNKREWAWAWSTGYSGLWLGHGLLDTAGCGLAMDYWIQRAVAWPWPTGYRELWLGHGLLDTESCGLAMAYWIQRAVAWPRDQDWCGCFVHWKRRGVVVPHAVIELGVWSVCAMLPGCTLLYYVNTM